MSGLLSRPAPGRAVTQSGSASGDQRRLTAKFAFTADLISLPSFLVAFRHAHCTSSRPVRRGSGSPSRGETACPSSARGGAPRLVLVTGECYLATGPGGARHGHRASEGRGRAIPVHELDGGQPRSRGPGSS